MTDAVVEVTRSYLKALESDRRWLRCLEAAGVDNWSGIDSATDLLNKRIKNDTASI